MSLVPAKTINFDGSGLIPTALYVEDSSGVGHFHPWKAGSTVEFDITFPGVDVSAVTFSMDVRASVGAADPKLSTSLTGDSQITVTANPGGSRPNTVRFAVSAAGTASLQAANASTIANHVFDIEAAQSGRRDRWVSGTIAITTEITRA